MSIAEKNKEEKWRWFTQQDLDLAQVHLQEMKAWLDEAWSLVDEYSESALYDLIVDASHNCDLLVNATKNAWLDIPENHPPEKSGD